MWLMDGACGGHGAVMQEEAAPWAPVTDGFLHLEVPLPLSPHGNTFDPFLGESIWAPK